MGRAERHDAATDEADRDGQAVAARYRLLAPASCGAVKAEGVRIDERARR
jgi:hypothetical protein